MGLLSRQFRLKLASIMQVLLPRLPVGSRFGLLPVRSPLLGKSLTCFLFLRVLRCFSSPRLPPADWQGIQHTSVLDGLPHSDICGSLLVCSSPQLIAALHVLLRLCMPRHPPCALSMLLLYGLHGVSARACLHKYSCYWFNCGPDGDEPHPATLA